MNTWTLTILSCLTAVLTGCAEQIDNPGKSFPTSPAVEETQSKELQRVQFADVPVPQGFELVSRGNRSFSYQAGGVRVAGFRYWGQQPPEQVAAFYKRTMPLETYGWTPAGEQKQGAAEVLEFTKARQTCKLTIQKEEGATVIQMRVRGPTE